MTCEYKYHEEFSAEAFILLELKELCEYRKLGSVEDFKKALDFKNNNEGVDR